MKFQVSIYHAAAAALGQRCEPGIGPFCNAFKPRLTRNWLAVALSLFMGGFAPVAFAQTSARITSVTTSNGKVIVRWQGGSAPYQVQCRTAVNGSWQDIDGLTSSGTSGVTNVLTENAAFYRVISGVPNSSDNKAPSVPTGLSAVAVSCNQINLSWSASTDAGTSGLKGYNVYRNGVFLRQVTATSTSDTGLTGGTTYSYTVSAVDNARNQSAKSSAVSRATPACIDTVVPSTPGGFAVTAVSCNQMNLSWNAASDTGGSGLRGYNVYRNGTFLKQVLAPATSTSDFGLSASTTYFYSVTAVDNANNQSLQTAVLSRTTTACVDTTPPTVPGGLNVTAASCNQINIYWNASTDVGSGVRAYNVFRNGAFLKQVTATLTSDSGLNASTGYSYTVSAVDNAGLESGQSAPGSSTTPPCACNYSVSPTSASAAASGGSSSVGVTANIGCNWTASSGAGWITLTGTTSGSGNGTVNYSVAANTSTSPRSGTLTIAGQTFTVNQAGGIAGDNPPTATLTSPTPSATISGWMALIGSASDDRGVTRVEFWCNGSVLIGTASVAPYGISYNSANLPNGVHSFTCKAFDTAGQSTSSAAVSATVNNVVITGGEPQFVRDLVGGDVKAKAVAIDRSNNSIVAGFFNGTVDFGGGSRSSTGMGDLFIAKYTSQNGLLWAKTLGGTGGDDAAFAVATDSQDNIIVTGLFYGTLNFDGTVLTSAGGPDIFVAKLSPSGGLLWARRFGGAGNDAGRAVAMDSNDNIVLLVNFNGGVDFGTFPLGTTTEYNIAVVKLSSGGVTVWAKAYGGSSPITPTAVALDRTGDVVITGKLFGPSNLGGGTTSIGGIFVAKYSGGDGSYRWAKALGGSIGNGIATDPSTGNIFVTGGFQGSVDFGNGVAANAGPGGGLTVFLVAYDSSGNCLWVRTSGGATSNSSDQGQAVKVDAAGNLAFTGTRNFQHFVQTFRISGSSQPVDQWQRQAGGVGMSVGNAIAFDGLNHVVTVGSFYLAVDFGGLSITPRAQDGFVAQFTK